MKNKKKDLLQSQNSIYILELLFYAKSTNIFFSFQPADPYNNMLIYLLFSFCSFLIMLLYRYTIAIDYMCSFNQFNKSIKTTSKFSSVSSEKIECLIFG